MSVDSFLRIGFSFFAIAGYAFPGFKNRVKLLTPDLSPIAFEYRMFLAQTLSVI